MITYVVIKHKIGNSCWLKSTLRTWESYRSSKMNCKLEGGAKHTLMQGQGKSRHTSQEQSQFQDNE